MSETLSQLRCPYDSTCYRVKSLLNTPPATLLAKPPPYMALDAKFEAWLNLSHLEKASVFVIVRTSAMTNLKGNPRQHSAIAPLSKIREIQDLPIRLSQMTFSSLTMANIASPTHNAG